MEYTIEKNKQLEATNKLLAQSIEIMTLLNEYYDNQDMSKAAFFRKVNQILTSEKC